MSEQPPNAEWLASIARGEAEGSETTRQDHPLEEGDWGECTVVIEGEMFQVGTRYLGTAEPLPDGGDDE